MKVVNIVMCGRFSKGVKLSELKNSVYRPERFSGAVLEHSGSTFLIFGNGSFVSLGCKSLKKGRFAAKSLAHCLELNVTKCEPKNIVLSHKLKFHIDMNGLYEKLKSLGRHVTYEEELFNGMSWKEGGGTVRLFHTGSFFVTGLNRVKALKGVCDMVKKITRPLKKVIKGDVHESNNNTT